MSIQSIRKRFLSGVFSSVAALLLWVSPAWAGEATGSQASTNNTQETSSEASKHSDLYQPLFATDDDQWQFGILLYAFLPFDTDITTKLPGVPVLPEQSISLDLNDAMELLNMTFSGRVEAHREDFGLFVEGYYVTMGLNQSPAKFDFDQYFVDFGVSYMLPPLRFSDDGPVALFTEIELGGRYVHFKDTLNFYASAPAPFAGTTREASANYMEPFIGARLTLPFAEKWTFVTSGDVGGFGVGSELTWTVVGGFAFHPSRRWEIALGYRAYSLDYDEGSGTGDFKFEQFQHGPYLGLGFRF